jgi:hypothetical protein
VIVVEVDVAVDQHRGFSLRLAGQEDLAGFCGLGKAHCKERIASASAK